MSRRDAASLRIAVAWFAAIWLCAAGAASSQERGPRPDANVSANDFGGIGLLQMRTARFGADGLFNIGYSRVDPYKRYSLNIHFLPWVEATFRYTEIRNRLYSPFAFFSGGQSYKDRGADLKFRLLKERDYIPAIAIGLQDAMGTGLFAGEYLVTSKRYRDLDFSLGLGWGYIGSRGTIQNPMKILSPNFGVRTGAEGLGGVPAFFSFLSGPSVGLFGGVEYRTPIEGLSLKFEYDGHDYSNEPFEIDLPAESPINIGLNFRPYPWIDLGFAIERGEKMLRFTLRSDFNAPGVQKFDPPPPPIGPRPELAALISGGVPSVEETAAVMPPAPDLPVARVTDPAVDVFDTLASYGLIVGTVQLNADQMVVSVSTEMDRRSPADLEAAAAAALADMPSDIAAFTLILVSNGVATAPVTVRKSQMLGAAAADSLFGDLAALGLDVVGVELDGPLARVTVDPIDPNAVIDLTAAANAATRALAVAGTTIIDARGRRAELSITPENQMPADLRENAGRGFRLPPVDPTYSKSEQRAVAVRLAEALQAQAFILEALELSERRAIVYMTPLRFRQVARNVGYSARIVANNLPAPIEEITIVSLNGGMEDSRFTIFRSDLERGASGRASTEEILAHADITAGRPWWPGSANQVPGRYPRFGWSLTPQTRQHIGGPDQFVLYQFWLALNMGLDITRGLSVSAIAGKNLYNNFDRIKLKSDSVLPKVRSDIKEYLQQGNDNIVRLQADYMFKPAEDLYARVSAGLFEEMFGGVGAEVLYRPFESRLAVGLEVNQVRQRTFDQLFKYRDYEVTTGSLSFYYNLPYKDLLGVVSIGQYLAGDVGVTFDLSRRFESGIRVGAWATLTNVSYAAFGEGSFDKGFFFSIPFELFMTNSSTAQGVFGFRPLFRDGGQRLIMGNRLFEVTAPASYGEVARDWPQFLK